MKKVLKYSTILSVAAVIAGTSVPTVTADTGGYVRVKGMESHFHGIGFNDIGCVKDATTNTPSSCRLASESSDDGHATTNALLNPKRENELRWDKDDGEGIVAGADYGFFRLEIEGTYQKGNALGWRGHTVTGGSVHQARIFANVVVEPFDLLEILGEFGGIDALVQYNPAHYGISPYALYGYGVMGGLLENLTYNTTDRLTSSTNANVGRVEGQYAGGATAAVNVGAGVNIGLDQLARGFSTKTGTSLPEYFKLPVEFSIGYHWQVGMDELLWDSVDEDLGIDDGGLTYSVGLKW